MAENKKIQTGVTQANIEQAESPEQTGSDSFGSYSIGHNLSTNSRTLNEGQWSLGSLYFGYGISDNFTVGTSLFVINSFKMANVMARYGFDISSNERLSFDFAYFKTFGGRVKTYPESCYFFEKSKETRCYQFSPQAVGFVMEAINMKATYTKKILDWYRANSTLSYFYYIEELMPFSFRMDPANPDPYTINLTSLHEFRLHETLFINYEFGFWGFNYQYPYIHTGLSINVQKDFWLLGIGASTTFSPSFPEKRARYFVGYDSRMSIHPEIELQVFF